MSDDDAAPAPGPFPALSPRIAELLAQHPRLGTPFWDALTDDERAQVRAALLALAEAFGTWSTEMRGVWACRCPVFLNVNQPNDSTCATCQTHRPLTERPGPATTR